MEWQPIETAPKDWSDAEKLVLLLESGHPDDYHSRVIPGFWGDRMAGLDPEGAEDMCWINWHEGFTQNGDWHTIKKPTHWMPLPEPPQ